MGMCGDIDTVTGSCIGGTVGRHVDGICVLQMACLWRNVKLLDNRCAMYRSFEI